MPPPANDLEPVRRGMDRVSVALVAASVLFLAAAAWLRFHRPAAPEPLALGAAPPPLGLLNLETSEPLLLLGLKGKVVWIVFWSSSSPSGKAVLPRLEDAWRRLRANRRFTLVAAAVDADHPERVRAALDEIHASLPAYLATAETRSRFGVERADPPLHVLIGPEGRIAALVRGGGPTIIDRLRDQVRGWLDELDPLGSTRFAWALRPAPAAGHACEPIGPADRQIAAASLPTDAIWISQTLFP